MSFSNQSALDETDDPAIRYAPASDGLESYDFWKCTEPPDDDQVYLDTWDEAEKRALEMKRNALEMIRNEEIYQETWTRYPNPKTNTQGQQPNPRAHKGVHMQKSDSIAALAGALAKAQSEIQGAKKDSENPFFKAKYADLSSVWDACRVALTKNGLSVIQTPSTEITENVTIIRVGTLLAHSSGEWISEELSAIPVKDDPQGIGSCVTYLRRYALSAFTGVAPEDDDGNAASHSNGSPTQRPKSQSKPPQGQTATEVAAIKQALVDTCKLLNAAGDKPEWDSKRLSEYSMQEYGVKADKLELEPLRELLKKLSLKLDAVKAAAKGGDPTEIERQAMIATVQAKYTEKQISEGLKDMAQKAAREDVPTLEMLSLDQLVALKDEFIIPF